MAQAIEAKVAECLDMAMKARLKAKSAQSAAELRFWQKMEERWILIAQTYRDTEQQTRAWLSRAPPEHGYEGKPKRQRIDAGSIPKGGDEHSKIVPQSSASASVSLSRMAINRR